MRFDSGSTDIPTAGSRVQISNTKDRVLWIRFHAVAANGGLVFFGVSDVSSTHGRKLAANEKDEIDFRIGNEPGSVTFDTFYVDAAANGYDIDWEVILA